MKRHQLIHHAYADDTQIYASCRPADSVELCEKVSVCVDEVSAWMASTPDPSLSPTHLSIRRGCVTTTHYTHHQVSLMVSHNTALDVQLNSTMRLVSGTLRSTPLPRLPVLSNIEPPALQRKATTDKQAGGDEKLSCSREAARCFVFVCSQSVSTYYCLRRYPTKIPGQTPLGHNPPCLLPFVRRLVSGSHLVGRIGSGVWVSVSFQQKYPPGSVL